MNSATRKTFWIMLGIMVAEGWPMALTLMGASPRAILHIYTTPVWLWPAWAAAAVVAGAYVLHSARAMPLIASRFFDLHLLKLLAVPFALISGTMEELWFRRMGMDWAATHGFGILSQITFSALTFGLLHGVWGLFARNVRVAVGAMLATGILGAALGVVYLLGQRSIAPCVWAHIAINLAVEPWLLLAAISRPQPETVERTRSFVVEEPFAP